VTSRAEEYRRYARRCVEIAPTFQDEEARATLLGQAQAWLRLAHLALANRHCAELAVQILRQRAIVKHALDTGQRSEMEESLLHALGESLRIFEKHRIFLLSCSVNRPSMSLDRQGPSSEIWVSMSQRSRPTSHSVSIGSEPSNAATRGGQRCDVMPTVGREAPDPVVKVDRTIAGTKFELRTALARPASRPQRRRL
jgi:hypothetical protein